MLGREEGRRRGGGGGGGRRRQGVLRRGGVEGDLLPYPVLKTRVAR